VKRRLTLAIAALAAFGLIAGFATSATAHPNKTTACTSCHGTAAVTAVTATPIAGTNNGTTIQYQITVTPPAGSTTFGYAVFKGTTATGMYASAKSGIVTLNVATAYTIWAADPNDGAVSLAITTPAGVVTPPADTIAPVTTSDALATYVGSATIHLTATDNAGGSGVAATYYILDGGAQTAGTLVNVSALGSHTLKFWSVDVAGNVETQKTANFTITAPVVLDTIAPVTTSDALSTYVSSAVIHLSATDNVGGSGVAATYYVLDGGSQTAGTIVTVGTVGDHTLAFWSVDVAGNIEAHNTAAFTVTAPVITPTPTPDPSDDPTPTPIPSGISKVTIHVMGTNSHDLRGAAVTLVNTATGAKFTVKTDRHGNAVITGVPFGSYTVTAAAGHTLATGKLAISTSRTKLNLRVRNMHSERSMHDD
jgi:hypothetical protein